MTREDRDLNEGQLEIDVLEIDRLLNKEPRTSEDVRTLVHLFAWYADHSPEAFRNMPRQLAQYLARELVPYVNKEKSTPFDVRGGRPSVVDWQKVEDEVKLLLEFPLLDESSSKPRLMDVFQYVLDRLELESEESIDLDVLDARVKKFKRANEELLK